MNMTVVLISKRSIEMLLLVVCMLSLTLGASFTVCGHLKDGNRLRGAAGEELPESARAIVDVSKPLDDHLLNSIVKEYSESVKRAMDSEMDKLIGELEAKASTEKDPVDDLDHVNTLKRANEQASDEIKTRIELASDTSGALPQWSPGQVAADLVSAASSRLQAAGSFTGDKLRSLTGRISKKVPAKLRRFFRWPSFSSFKSKFNKSYSAREELYRQMIYLRNQVVVGVQRVRFLLRRDKHITKATEFADWTSEEYHEVYNNEEAETGADADESAPLDPAAKAKMQQVAASGKNIFGQTIAVSSKRTKVAPEHQNELERNKRNANDDEDGNEDEDEYDELGDSEDDDLELTLGEEDDPAMSAEEEFKLLEQFSNANLEADDDLSKASDLADEALALNSDFKPIDLRDTGCISEAENQDSCGNCYSHVVVSAASYYHCMASEDKSKLRFHSRFISDCGYYMSLENGKEAHIRGCRGGRMSHAFMFAKTVGVQRYGEYQIARLGSNWKTDNCAYTRPEDILNTGWKLTPIQQFRESRYTTLTLGEVDLHLRSIGPVFCNIRTWAGFKDFGGGIYDGFEDADQVYIHSVLIIGHDIDSKGRDYYIVKNSHGVNWGEDGFFRIYKDSLSYFGLFFSGLTSQSVE